MTVETYLVRTSFALLLIVGVLGGAGFAVRRGWLRLPAGMAGAPAAPLKVIQTLGVTPGNRMIVVEFGSQRLLLAAGRSGIAVIGSAVAE